MRCWSVPLPAFLLSLLLVLPTAAVRLGAAPPKFGEVVAVLPVPATRLLTDPARQWVYAVVPQQNAVVILDSATLTVAATIPVAARPVDLSLSRDGSRLYVACNGSADAAVTVVDVNSLRVVATYALPGVANGIAAGLDNRLYVTTVDQYFRPLYQLDADTGAVQTVYSSAFMRFSRPRLSPDGRTLYVSTGDGFEMLSSYDATGPTLGPIARVGYLAIDAAGLFVSHDGSFVCLPSANGNFTEQGLVAYTYDTALYSGADISQRVGTFHLSGGAVAFSPDDSRIYIAYNGSGGPPYDWIKVYGTQDGDLLDGTFLTYGALNDASISDLAMDATGGYLFVATGTQYGPEGESQCVAVLTTGAPGVRVRPALPVITSPLRLLTVVPGSFFAYQIVATGEPTSFDAPVLPEGVFVDPQTGLVAGIAPYGIFNVQFSATNAAGTTVVKSTLDALYEWPVPYPKTPLDVENAAVNVPFSYQVETWARAQSFGAVGLPPGLNMDQGLGIISGIPLRGGTYAVSFEGVRGECHCPGVLVITVAAPPPVVTVTTTVRRTTPGGAPGRWRLTRAGGDFTQPLTVTYTLTGTARNGTDYQRRTGIATIPAHQDSVVVTVQGKGALGGDASRTAQLILHPSGEYGRGTPLQGKITIRAPGGG